MIHACDLCGSADYTLLEAARPYIGDQEPPAVCNECGFIYVRERRDPQAIAKAWDEIWSEEQYSSNWPAVKARLYYVAEWLDQTIGLKGKSVLDIGAGEGLFLDFVKDRGGTPVGLEPYKKNVLKIRSRDIACYHGTAETVEAGQHDLVTINWTLENCGDCIGLLKRARSFLRPGGHVCVATGSRILVPFKKPLSAYFSKTPMDTHCFRFSAFSLGTALALSNFMPKENNRFEDCDWLVWLGEALPENHEIKADWRNDPGVVIQHFRNWKAFFP